MKIRQGFVSNSSTTSFCIYGASFDGGSTALIEELKKLGESVFAFIPEEKRKELKKMIGNDEEHWDIEDAIASILSIEGHCGYEDYNVYLGDSWKNIKDDETGKQFKERIETQIKKLFPDAKFGTHEEAFRDG